MSYICFLVTVKELYRVHLIFFFFFFFKKPQKEMVYRDQQIQKADLEILLLERQLRWVHCHGETGEYVNVWNYITNPDCCFCTFRE